eukprot:1465140-Pyramimonas_sp.AAC.1
MLSEGPPSDLKTLRLASVGDMRSQATFYQERIVKDIIVPSINAGAESHEKLVSWAKGALASISGCDWLVMDEAAARVVKELRTSAQGISMLAE